MRRLSCILMFALVTVASGFASGPAQAAPNAPDSATGFLLNGRRLTPAGAQVPLGNFPTGGAVTADGRFLWTVSAGQGANDVRIVDTSRRRVLQTIALSGATGGISLDSRHRRAYISVISASRWWPTQAGLPGAAGNFVLVYGWKASDHTRGTQPGFPTPRAMVADGDLALGQLVDMISHSKIWSSSVIFVVEDDSQDGADHVNAHRIPVAVISPYARQGAIIHRRYDLLSVVRSMELNMGMKALSLNDALASPMYAAFTSEPLNSDPVDVITPAVDLLERNTPAAPWAALSSRLPLGRIDPVPQWQIDAILWRSVYGASSAPPPPGPGAEYYE